MKKNRIIHNTMMLYIMNIAKLIFPLVTLPYLIRILSVDKYAVVTYVKAVMVYVQLIIDFGFLLSATKDIVNSGDDKTKIGKITGNVILGKCILSGISLIFLLILSSMVPMLKHNMLYTLLSFTYVALSVFLVDFLFRGLEKMQVITIRYLITRSITTLLTFVIIRNDNDIIFIPLLEILGNVVAIIWVWYEVKKTGIRVRVSSLESALIMLKESFVYFVSNMASTAFGALNTLFVGFFCTSTDVAFWGLAMQFVEAVQAMYTPVTNGVYPQMVREKKLKLIKNVMMVFMPIVVAGCLVVYCGADDILLLIGGAKYADAAPLLKWFIPLLFISFPATLFGWPVLGAIGKSKETTKTTVITAMAQVLGLILLIVIDRFTLINLAILRAMTELLMCCMRMRYCYKYRELFNEKKFWGNGTK